MQLITQDLYKHIETDLANVRSSVLIISPYITKDIVEWLLPIVDGKEITMNFLTRSPGVAYVLGESDIEAVERLYKAGASIRMLNNLQAKIYLFDNQILFIGSADLTNLSMGMSKMSNKEVMIRTEVTDSYIESIYKAYWEHPETELFTNEKQLKEGIKEIKHRYATLQNEILSADSEMQNVAVSPTPHSNILVSLIGTGEIQSYEEVNTYNEHSVYQIDNKQQIKIIEPINDGDIDGQQITFRYSISNELADLIRKRIIHGLVFVLSEPDDFVCLPAPFFGNNVLKRSLFSQGKWECIINQSPKELLLTVTGKYNQRKIPINQYKGKLHFRIKGIQI